MDELNLIVDAAVRILNKEQKCKFDIKEVVQFFNTIYTQYIEKKQGDSIRHERFQELVGDKYLEYFSVRYPYMRGLPHTVRTSPLKIAQEFYKLSDRKDKAKIVGTLIQVSGNLLPNKFWDKK